MTTANQRSALAALNHVRPIIARLDIARHAEDVAADLIEGWNGTEVALRSLLGGSALSGQALIRELRQREMRDASNTAQGRSIQEFMLSEARRQHAVTGMLISTTDPESFIRGSADAGLLRIVR